MFNAILKFSINNRYLVLGLSLILAIIGAASYKDLIIDAVPDITNIQVQINTEAVGYSPYETEQRITIPIELLLAGIPNLDYTRSISKYGLSQVTVAFQDGTDIHFARQLLAQRIQESKDLLPQGVTPKMGPIATGLGEIFMFTLKNANDAKIKRSLQELREIEDWVVKPQLRKIHGVVEINSIGGASKQILVIPNLEELRAFELTFEDLTLAIAKNNSNVGAGFIEQNGQQFLLRVPAQVTDFSKISKILVGVHDGIPTTIGDVAKVEIGSELRNGAATENGKEVVLGTVFMMMGENGRNVSKKVSTKILEIQNSLPEGLIIEPVYNRSNLIDLTIATVKKNLFEGALLVVVVLFLALGNLRAAIITALVIPITMLMTIFGMVQGKLSANLMSLGALDFGLIVDGAVILVENCIKQLGAKQKIIQRRLTKDERLEVIFSASSEVRQATMFGELIIIIVYIPILALAGIEGKMYHPMALTVIIALCVAFVLSLTFVPAAAASFLTGNFKDEHGGIIDYSQRFYRKILGLLVKARYVVVLCIIILFIVSIKILSTLGSEFIPALDEGDITLQSLRIPGTSLTQAIKMQHLIEAEIKKIPEVKNVFAKIGTAEIATDPMPPSMADGFVILKPRAEWSNPKKPKREIVSEIESIVLKIPGNNYEFTQPIQMRFNELIAGVRSDIAVKIFGDELELLLQQGAEIKKILSAVPGATDIKVEQVSGLPIITIKPKADIISRLGLNKSVIQDIVKTAYAGEEVSRFYAGDRNFPIVIRLSEEDRSNIEKISELPIPIPSLQSDKSEENIYKRPSIKSEAPSKAYIPLKDIAEINLEEGANQISREDGKRRIVVTANVRDRDLGSFVEEAQRSISKKFKPIPSYWISWGGQYENLISAKNKLKVVVPLTLLSVFGLLYFTFRSFKYSLIIFSGIPFGLSGGIFALWLRGMPFSISAAVGFIALSGVSVLNGLVLVSFIKTKLMQEVNTITAVIEGSVARLRPVMMTALVASLGFLPMAFSAGTGSEVQRPLATVVIGGIISSTILTLIVLPLLIIIFEKKKNVI